MFFGGFGCGFYLPWAIRAVEISRRGIKRFGCLECRCEEEIMT